MSSVSGLPGGVVIRCVASRTLPLVVANDGDQFSMEMQPKAGSWKEAIIRSSQ